MNNLCEVTHGIMILSFLFPLIFGGFIGIMIMIINETIDNQDRGGER